MIGDKRGLAAIIGTLLIILLVIVAVGIIWVVLRGTLQGGVEDLSLNEQCLSISIRPNAASCDNVTNTCQITFTREAGGDDIAGIKLIIHTTTASLINTTAGNVDALQTQTITDIDVSSLTTDPEADVTRIEATAYLLDREGNEHICAGTQEFNL